jgi:capsular polysaccharide biosynthesis protein
MPVWHFTADTYIKIKSKVTGAPILPPPKGVVESVRDWVNATNAREGHPVHTFKEISPVQEVQRTLPHSIEEPVNWQYRVHQTHQQPATFVASIAGGRVYEEGQVITPDDNLVIEVSRMSGTAERVSDPKKHPIFAKETLPPLQKVKGKVALLSAVAGRGYYHWMFDVLPRLHLVQKAGFDLQSIDKFLVNSYVSKFHVETLQMLGITREKVLESHWNPHIQAEQLIVPSLVGEPRNIPGWACDFLRKAFLPKIPAAPHSPKRIYINRGQVTHRRVTNEADITAYLDTLGFKSIAFESIPLLEQFSLLANADVVVVPHGAGLTNIVFCKPGTKVIELLSPNALNIMYWTLSNQIGGDYYSLQATGERPPEYVYAYRNNDSLTIDMNELKALLSLAGIA